jgi:hypothetical protein
MQVRDISGRDGPVRRGARGALELDPLGVASRFVVAWGEYKNGRHEEANAQLDELLELYPHAARQAREARVLNVARCARGAPGRRARRNFDRRFDEGEDITADLELSQRRRPGLEPRRVNVDFPSWMVEALDREARRLGVTRQSVIKMWLAERIERRAS